MLLLLVVGACRMQKLASSLGGEVWAPVGCARPGVASSSCWVYDPAVWQDGFLRAVVLKDCSLPSSLSGVELQLQTEGGRGGAKVTVKLTATTTVLMPAQLILPASLSQPGHGLRKTCAGLYAATWSLCTATKSRRPVLVVIDRFGIEWSTVSEVDLSIPQPGLFDPCPVERKEEELLPVFVAAGQRPDLVEVEQEPSAWLCARGATIWGDGGTGRSGKKRKAKQFQARGGTSRLLPDTSNSRLAARAYSPKPDLTLEEVGPVQADEGLFFLPLMGSSTSSTSWAVVEEGVVVELEAMGELGFEEYDRFLASRAMQIVQYDELGKLKELPHGLTLSTPDDGIVACWVSRAHNNRVHGGALDGRKFWGVGELCEKLSIGFSRVEVPSTGVQVLFILRSI